MIGRTVWVVYAIGVGALCSAVTRKDALAAANLLRSDALVTYARAVSL